MTVHTPVTPRLGAWLIGLAGLALTTGAAAGDPLRDALMWHPDAKAPAAEAPQTKAAAATPDVISNDAGEPSIPERTVHVKLKDIPAGQRATEGDRVHIQGGESPATRDIDRSRALFPTRPINPPSADPLTLTQRDPGDTVRQFDGIDSSQSAWRPPDMQLAVGPQYVVEVANSGFALYTKTGIEASPYLEYQDFLSDNQKYPSWCVSSRPSTSMTNRCSVGSYTMRGSNMNPSQSPGRLSDRKSWYSRYGLASMPVLV
ncbi:MAG: hypothetical protein AAFU65_09610 [Pseudomonadota bacterium]